MDPTRRLCVPFVLAAVAAAQGGATVATRDLAGTVTGLAAKDRVRVTLWLDDMKKNTLEPIAETFAAADGTFVLKGAPWFERQQWGSHSCVLVARVGDRVAMRGLRGEQAPTSGLTLALELGIELRGVLRDEVSGEPVAGAWVWPSVFGGTDDVWLTEPMLPWRVTTDEHGRFVLRGLPPRQAYKLRAGGEQHASTWIDVTDPKEPVAAALPRGVTIEGTVRMPDGEPAARVRVCAAGQGAGWGHTFSDDAGHFAIQSLAPDLYKVWAEAPDLTVIAVQGIRLAAGEIAKDQQVQLVCGGFIVGRIVDRDTGLSFVPGPSTDVAMYGPARGPGGACECTPVLPDGTFRIRAPAGKNHIYLRAANGWSEPSADVVVVEGEEAAVEWKVARGGGKRRG